MDFSNRFIYKIKNTIFYFIRSLFSKKILLYIIIFLLFMLFTSNKSNAASYELIDAISNGDLEFFFIPSMNKFIKKPSFTPDLSLYVDNPEEFIFWGVCNDTTNQTGGKLVYSDKPFISTSQFEMATNTGNTFIVFTYDSSYNYTYSQTIRNGTPVFWWARSIVNHDVYDRYGSLFMSNNWHDEGAFLYPQILNTKEDLASNDYGTLLITAGDFKNFKSFNFILYSVETVQTDNGLEYENESIIYNTTLSSNSPFFKSTQELGYYYEIPISNFNLQDNTKYNYLINWDLFNNTYYLDFYTFSTEGEGGEGGEGNIPPRYNRRYQQH